MDSRSAETKWCNRCDRTLLVEQFYPRKDRPGQYLATCRTCRRNDQHDRWFATRPAPRVPQPVPLEKSCTCCGRVKTLERFSPRKSARDGRSSHCRDCRNQEKARYNESHSEERKSYNRRYYQENAEACGKRIRASIAKKPEKYRQIHSDWKKSHKDAVNASTHKRRALLASGGSWTDLDWQRLKAQYDWRCLRCGKQEVVDGIALCFDHVVPLSLGGLNTISNGQPLCKSCNSTKHRKVVDLRR